MATIESSVVVARRSTFVVTLLIIVAAPGSCAMRTWGGRPQATTQKQRYAGLRVCHTPWVCIALRCARCSLDADQVKAEVEWGDERARQTHRNVEDGPPEPEFSSENVHSLCGPSRESRRGSGARTK